MANNVINNLSHQNGCLTTGSLAGTSAPWRRISITSFLRNIGILVIIILPFQGLVPTLMGLQQLGATVKYPTWVKAISYIDEVSFIILLGLGVTFFLLKPKVYNIPRLPFTKWLIVFIAYGVILSRIKTIPFFQAAFSIYDLDKSIIVLFPFALMNYDEGQFFRLIKLVIRLGVVLAIAGILGEILALGFKIGINYFVTEGIRMGLYRIVSIAGIGSQNYLGLYGILCFFLTYSSFKKDAGNYSKKGLLLIMILLTMSRQAWLGFLMVFILMKKWLKHSLPFLPIVLLLIYSLSGTNELDIDPKEYPRTYAYLESVKILISHPLTGIGPGMFGDLASVLWKSPIYNQWPAWCKERVFAIRGIDAFWPGVWGGYGLIGLVLYCAIWLALFKYLGKVALAFKEEGSDKLSNVGFTLKYFMVALAIMGFAAGLNCPFVAYTYFALVGIYVSLYEKKKKHYESKYYN
jgi:hypothetical protein